MKEAYQKRLDMWNFQFELFSIDCGWWFTWTTSTV